MKPISIPFTSLMCLDHWPVLPPVGHSMTSNAIQLRDLSVAGEGWLLANRPYFQNDNGAITIYCTQLVGPWQIIDDMLHGPGMDIMRQTTIQLTRGPQTRRVAEVGRCVLTQIGPVVEAEGMGVAQDVNLMGVAKYVKEFLRCL